MNVREAVAAIDADINEKSGFLIEDESPAVPHQLWIEGYGWIRRDGSLIFSADGPQQDRFYPSLLGRIRLRQAVRRWLKRRGHDLVSESIWSYLPQAIQDQRATDYPGCVEGVMFCRAFCGCLNESSPNPLFVISRAGILRDRAVGKY